MNRCTGSPGYHPWDSPDKRSSLPAAVAEALREANRRQHATRILAHQERIGREMATMGREPREAATPEELAETRRKVRQRRQKLLREYLLTKDGSATVVAVLEAMRWPLSTLLETAVAPYFVRRDERVYLAEHAPQRPPPRQPARPQRWPGEGQGRNPELYAQRCKMLILLASKGGVLPRLFLREQIGVSMRRMETVLSVLWFEPFGPNRNGMVRLTRHGWQAAYEEGLMQ